MRMCIFPGISRGKRHTRISWPGDSAENKRERGWRIDSVTRVTVVESWFSAGECSDERWRR